MKKFNEEIYKGIKNNGSYEDQYYKYLIIEKKLVFKSWKSSSIDNLDYKFYGVLIPEKRDIYTMENLEEIQKEYNEEARKMIIEGIRTQEEYYLNIQEKAFNSMINNEEYKRNIMYDYIDSYGYSNFNYLYMIRKTPEELKNDLINKIITVNNSYNNHEFLDKFINESKNDIIKEIKEKIFNCKFIDNWSYEREYPEIELNFNNYVSLSLNKINYIINKYIEFYNNPSQTLLKTISIYDSCIEFYNKHKNKTCYITLKNDKKLKCYDYCLFYIMLENGKEEISTYRIFTNKDQEIIKSYNKEVNGKNWETDLFIKDIKSIEFNNKIIYMEK